MTDQQRDPFTPDPGARTGDATPPSQRIDTTVPHPARRYDYWLGGKDNFAADRASGDAIAAAYPPVRIAAVENRKFLRRAVTYLVREAGIRQFLDIGTGIPTANNTHEVAQSIVPDARVVYVDNDPIVLVHARALLTSSPDGATAYIDADLRDPEKILNDPDLLRTLDMSQPIGLMLVAVLHFIMDEDGAHEIVRRLVDAMPSGSHLTVTNGTLDFVPPELAAQADAISARSGINMALRNRAEFGRFFEGLDLVEPGIQPVSQWRADDEPQPRPSPAESAVYAAIGRKP
ncbi:SAM-dependent methyltransferase [Rhizomonospora bruguierae]|uniref:SAM-dependent methyltransferase n=1 Tax=Rhizomonospora bruguierae TaxID=1581705 RepID=UPI0020BF91BA|nr:SAM-dependent methyltransferase [Micromonospora sp. NBRC 107566]